MTKYDTMSASEKKGSSLTLGQRRSPIMSYAHDIIKKCPLFHEIEEKDISAMLGCLGAKQCRFPKNAAVFSEGDPAIYIGIVLSGRVQIVREDYYGNRSIVANIGPAQIFGESFSCAGAGTLPVSVIAAEDVEVLLLDCRRIGKSCQNACAFHCQVIYNLMQVMARKNLMFNEKLEITGKRTTREKLMTFLLLQAKKSQSDTFMIPFNRQELADYLEVDRSGLSVEISKLCRAGIIETDKKRFRILKKQL